MLVIIGGSLLFLFSTSASAVRVDFVGHIDYLDRDLNTGTFAGSTVGTQIFGFIDDKALEVEFSNGTQKLNIKLDPPDSSSPVSVSMSLLNNNQFVDPLSVKLFNAILDEPIFTGGEILDLHQAGAFGEIDSTSSETEGAGLFLLHVYEESAFNETIFNPGLDFPEGEILKAFAISEFNSDGEPIYLAGGEMQVVPLPASLWFLIVGCGWFFGIQRFK